MPGKKPLDPAVAKVKKTLDLARHVADQTANDLEGSKNPAAPYGAAALRATVGFFNNYKYPIMGAGMLTVAATVAGGASCTTSKVAVPADEDNQEHIRMVEQCSWLLMDLIKNTTGALASAVYNTAYYAFAGTVASAVVGKVSSFAVANGLVSDPNAAANELSDKSDAKQIAKASEAAADDVADSAKDASKNEVDHENDGEVNQLKM